jgi:hypothetical protein
MEWQIDHSPFPRDTSAVWMSRPLWLRAGMIYRRIKLQTNEIGVNYAYCQRNQERCSV